MYSWITLNTIADWCGLHTYSGPEMGVKGIRVDSREVGEGDVFVAYQGASMDGYDYLEDAVARGALCVITERPAPEAISKKVPNFVVPNGPDAIVTMAAQLRQLFAGPVFAITGSAGKSSTKEMAAVLLGPNTLSAPGSFNNLMGVSRTWFEVKDSTEQVVLEMGMNAEGEIRTLCERFQPKGVLITNIGNAHIGKLGGKSAIYRAKKEMFEVLHELHEPGVPIGSVLNIDDPLVVRAHEEALPPRDELRTVRYSVGEFRAAADVQALEPKLDPQSGLLDMELAVGAERFQVQLPLFGLHHAQNVAAAVAIAHLFEVSLLDIQSRLTQIRPAPHRGEIETLENGTIVIDESYNSSPAALTSSLESLAKIDPMRRRVLFLGDMLELGEFSECLHREVGETLVALQQANGAFHVVVGVGSEMPALLSAVKDSGIDAECVSLKTTAEAIDYAKRSLRANDVVLVKGSRGIALEQLTKALTKR